MQGMTDSTIDIVCILHCRIPSSIYQAVMKYVILLQAKSELFGPVQTSLDEGIFVPRAEGLSQSCGGIQLFKNIMSITNDEQFCEKTFGMSRHIVRQ